jgi:2-alkenal reductase
VNLFRRLLILAAAAALLGAGYLIGVNVDRGVLSAQEAGVLTTDIERVFADVYARSSPSIVAIGIADPVFGEFSGGSGFVIDTQGHIVTNYHVIDDIGPRNRIEVNFFDGTMTRAEIVGTDPDSDIALLRVDLPAERLVALPMADSDSLVIGQMVLAIGSPFGQRWTLTSGIVSALERTIDGLGDYQIGAVIQTDAAINPGNSGGPLLNLRGEVVGVNAQIIVRDGQRANSGVGFAVPSNLVMRVVDELRDTGRVDYAFLGIGSIEDVNLRVIERLNLPDNTRGVRIGTVSGPAQAAGLRSNDIITGIDDRRILGFGSLLAYLAGNARPQQTVTVTVLRNGEEMAFPVTLASRPQPVTP